MWFSDQIKNPIDVSLHEVDAYYGTDGFISTHNELHIFEMRNLRLSQNCLNQLSESITEGNIKENSGINSYLRAIDIIKT